MNKSKIALLVILALAAIFGAALLKPAWVIGALGGAGSAAYMYHFRTLGGMDSWTKFEIAANMTLTAVILGAFLLHQQFAWLASVYFAAGAGFLSIYLVGFVVFATRRFRN
jgi:hypothetical protein